MESELNPITRLTLSAYGMHIADQIALVLVPLVAAIIFNASPQTIGILVACQSMAHLLGSIPFGIMVDRVQSKTGTIIATLISLVGFAGAAVSINLMSLILFAIFITIAGFGIVLFVLVSLSIIPKISTTGQLSNANAKLGISRAVSSFAVPLSIGILITHETAGTAFMIATLFALAAFIVAIRLPVFSMPISTRENILRSIAQGGKFVINNNLLLPISVCAIFWNLAFAALLVVMVPMIIDIYLAEPAIFGIALSFFGLASILGSWVVGRFSGAISPNIFLLFGPGCSVLAAFILTIAPSGSSIYLIYASFFLLGFGPSMWLITQNSVRQLVTPETMLGSVNAVIQTAIYGIRPLGALIGGTLTAMTSPQLAMIFVAIAFTLSFAASLFSRLRRISSFGELV